MIRDLDNTIEKLLVQRAPKGSLLANASINFQAPDATLLQKLTGPTVNCYLYEIVENINLRQDQPQLTRNADNTQAAYRSPPAAVDCIYCITAWTKEQLTDSVFDEHLLLSDILEVLFQYPVLPPDILQGKLANSPKYYRTAVAKPDGIKNQAEFWGTLNQRIKPSITYSVTVPIATDKEPQKMIPVVDKLAVETQYGLWKS